MTFQILEKSEPSFSFRDCSRRFVWGQCLFFRTVVISCVSLGLIAFVCEGSSEIFVASFRLVSG